MSKSLNELLNSPRQRVTIDGGVAKILRESTISEMARRLRALDERHQRAVAGWDSRGNQNSDTPYCLCGQTWPCPDRRILDGEIQ